MTLGAAAPDAGDDADGAMFMRRELTAMMGEEPMRAFAVEPAS